MHNSINNLIAIEKEIQQKLFLNKKQNLLPKIIAVSKTFPMQDILPLINHGHIHYGENKVQESVEKWTEIKKDFNHIQLHMIGKLQTNKVKHVVPLFDFIHSLDNLRLAKKISEEQVKKNKKLKIFIQVNIGMEEKKSGITPDKLESFYNICKNELKLDIVGLMCLPPNNNDTKTSFSEMFNYKEKTGAEELSMGMSNDYLEATTYGATFLRIGSKIFGPRS